MNKIELVKNIIDYPTLSEGNAAAYLQKWANNTGKCIVEVLPVEKTSELILVSGNKHATKYEHWVCRILAIPKVWNVDAMFWRTRVGDDEQVDYECTDVLKTYTVFSEFCGRDICQISYKYTSGGFVQWCEPINIDIPFAVGDIIIVSPTVLKKEDKTGSNDEITLISKPVMVDLIEILGSMNGMKFTPFLRVVVAKVVKDYGHGIKINEAVKTYRQYVRYVSGAIFLPLKPNDNLAIAGCHKIDMDKFPQRLQFLYKGHSHDYYVIDEDETIMGYSKGKEWFATPTCRIMKRAKIREITKYFYGHESKLIWDKEDNRCFFVEGSEGVYLYGSAQDVELLHGTYSFGLKRHCIGFVSKVNDSIVLQMSADKISFQLDLMGHFKGILPSQNIQDHYKQGNNVEKIKHVLGADGNMYLMATSAFSLVGLGWAVNNNTPFSFWFTKRSRILLDISNMQPFRNLVVLKPIPVETVEVALTDKQNELGLVAPEPDKVIPNTGVVVAVGSLCTETKVGMTVLYARGAGTTEGQHLILYENDIFGEV